MQDTGKKGIKGIIFTVNNYIRNYIRPTERKRANARNKTDHVSVEIYKVNYALHSLRTLSFCKL